MDFNISEEQEALQEMARDFLRERWPTDRSREGLDKRPAVIDDEVWQEIVEMGWLGVTAPEMTYDLPSGAGRLIQRANGYRVTLKRGEVIFQDGEPTGALPGKLLRGPQAA